jgi:hypothetical protein
MNQQEEAKDFLSLYLQYSAGTECPTLFHRWAAITCLGAWLGRDVYFRQGHFKIHPNLFTMLVGDAGTKKSTSIKMAARLFKLAGYDKFAARKTRQEKFLLDLEAKAMEDNVEDCILDQNLWGDASDSSSIAETLIAADEFNNFIGVGNTEFMSLLGELWDWGDEVFDHRLKNSKSVYLNRPTVSILGGNTATGMNLCFPQDSIGQGFFSRLILIHAKPTGIKNTWMAPVDEKLQEALIIQLSEIKNRMKGEVTLTPSAAKLLDKIYKSWVPLEDVRFASYANRRFSSLLKLVLIICANNLTMQITEKEAIYANTLLTAAEKTMTEALGEFGKNRNSDITHKILQFIDATSTPLTFKEVWKQVYTDLDKRDHLVEILTGLIAADRIQVVDHMYLPKKTVRMCEEGDTLDWSLLSEDEL